MTRTLLTLSLTLALGALGTAHAQLRPIGIIESSYELAFDWIVFPVATTGTVTVKPCADCASVVHPVDASTVYLLNRTAVPFEEFSSVVDERRRLDGGRAASVGVYYDIETQRVKRILLTYAAQ